MICKSVFAQKSARSLRKYSLIFTAFTALALCGAGQQALAQQGSECLACHTGLPATENNLIPDDMVEPVAAPAGCDYSSADLFGGWGWNPTTAESCPPIEGNVQQVATNANCDYSSAAQFGGWGWDPVAGESCPPLENSEDPHSIFPICSATLFDVDGDGFGFEDQASCIVTSDSAPAPTFQNQQTGNAVDLVRAYWDGNTDISNKVIQCDLYFYNSNSNQYQLEPQPFRAGANLNNTVFPSYRFNHLSLPPTAPFLGWIAEVASVDGSRIFPTTFGSVPNWTTDDGRYIGPTVLQSPYVELITRNNGAAAIRTWHESRFDTALDLRFSGNRVQRDGYFECWDTSGRDFTPTGRLGANTTSPVVVSDLVFTTEPSPRQQDPETIVNLYTNVPVNLSKAYWNYNTDLAGKTASCEKMSFRTSASGGNYVSQGRASYDFPDHFTSSGNRIYYWESVRNIRNSSFIVENGVLSNPDGSDLFNNVLFASDYVETVGNGVRFWTNFDEYSECPNIRPTGSAPAVVNNNQCDYSSAASFGGWGWNPVTRQSCPPQETTQQPAMTASDCDYSDAANFNGWGWNPVAGESCPPVSSTMTQTMTDTAAQGCDYSNAASNGGWGWNPVTSQSCAPR